MLRHVLSARAVDVLLVLDDLRVNSLEFGLQARVTGGLGGAVGATTGFGHVVVVVLELGDALTAPALVEMSQRSVYVGDGCWSEIGLFGNSRMVFMRLIETHQLPLPPPCFLVLPGFSPE